MQTRPVFCGGRTFPPVSSLGVTSLPNPIPSFADLAVAVGFILLNEAAKSTTEQHRARNKGMVAAP